MILFMNIFTEALFTWAVYSKSLLVFYYWLAALFIAIFCLYAFDLKNGRGNFGFVVCIISCIFSAIGAAVGWQYPSHDIAVWSCLCSLVVTFLSWFVHAIQKL